jgi:hypothetical protein
MPLIEKRQSILKNFHIHLLSRPLLTVRERRKKRIKECKKKRRKEEKKRGREERGRRKEREERERERKVKEARIGYPGTS